MVKQPHFMFEKYFCLTVDLTKQEQCIIFLCFKIIHHKKNLQYLYKEKVLETKRFSVKTP